MRTSASVVRSSFVCLTVVVLASACAALAGPRPDWWPEGRRPPFVQAVPLDSAAPRALLLRSARLMTDAPGAAEALASALPAALRGRPVAEGGLLLVQFAPDVAAADRAAILARHGAIAGDFVPNNALLARVPAASVEALAADPGVRWIGRVHPALKLATDLGNADPLRPSWLLRVEPAPGTTLDALAEDARRAGFYVTGMGDHGIDVEGFDDEGLLALARFDSVLSIHEIPQLEWHNSFSRWICQSNVTNSYSIHARGIKGAGQTVAVMDSGLDVNHCCFASQSGKIVDNRAWGGGVLGTGCANEHGTHTAGTAVCGGGQFNDGLAPDAGIVFQDVGTATNCTNVFPPNPLSSAWDDARTRGAFIHTNSWGGGSNLYTTDTRTIDNYMWNQQNFLIVYSAGNNGPNPSTLGSYSNAKNSVTVGGTRNGSNRERMYDFSSHGPAGDGRTLPDLTAPADFVSSALAASTPDPSCNWTNLAGTSMAAPAVAGTAALAREFFLKGYYPSGTATPADGFTPSAALVKAMLLTSARNMTNVGTRPDTLQGWGRVTLDDALWFSGEASSQRLRILDDRNTATGFTATGQEVTFDIKVMSTGTLKVMLVWTDYPGAALAAKALVNDLDLTVTLKTNNWTFTGNQGFDGGWSSSTSTTYDNLNNKEGVMIQSVSPQDVTIKVRAAAINNVTGHAQDYALVVVGPVDMPCSAPLPTGVGNSATHAKSGTNLVATWADRAAHHYVVYRGTTPNFMSGNPLPYRNNVVDENAGSPGIQWTDVGALSGTQNYYYLYSSANSCNQEVP